MGFDTPGLDHLSIFRLLCALSLEGFLFVPILSQPEGQELQPLYQTLASKAIQALTPRT